MNLKLVSFLALCGAFAVACGDSGSNTGGGTTSDGGNGTGGGSDGGGTTVLSGGNDPVGAGNTGGSPPEAPDCYDDGTAFVLDPAIVGGVEINQNLCTATQITDMFAACIGQGSSTELCDAFIAAAAENQACLDCAVGGGKPQPFPMPVTIAGDMFQYLSLYACMAEVAGLPECEFPFQNLIFCGNTACQSCDQDDDTKQNDCLNWAINDVEVCGAIEVPDTCTPLFSQKELPAECIGDATTFDAAFAIMADFYCGAP